LGWTLTKPGIEIEMERTDMKTPVKEVIQCTIMVIVCLEIKQGAAQTHQSIWRKFTILWELYQAGFFTIRKVFLPIRLAFLETIIIIIE